MGSFLANFEGVCCINMATTNEALEEASPWRSQFPAPGTSVWEQESSGDILFRLAGQAGGRQGGGPHRTPRSKTLLSCLPSPVLGTGVIGQEAQDRRWGSLPSHRAGG